MAWSKVNSGNSKPLGWWYHKLLCEFWYYITYNGNYIKKYYYHLDKLCSYGFNLYGDKIK